MYILKADYKTRISTPLLDTIIKEASTDSGEDLLKTVSKIAEDTLSSKAGVLYDIASELENSGSDRNYLILSLGLSIAVYELYQRIDDEEVPGKVVKNYNDALDMLEEISKGKSPINMPPKPAPPVSGGGEEGAEIDGVGLRRVGSQPKRTHSM